MACKLYLKKSAPAITFMIKNAFATGAFPKDWNLTNICLIPKAPKPDYITQFRPIGLCNVVYKILTKVIANRIKPLLNNLIAPTQFSFTTLSFSDLSVCCSCCFLPGERSINWLARSGMEPENMKWALDPGLALKTCPIVSNKVSQPSLSRCLLPESV